LGQSGFYPSFVRFEKKDGEEYAADFLRPLNVDNQPKHGSWINLEFMYQGMYLMDREMMEEYLDSKASLFYRHGKNGEQYRLSTDKMKPSPWCIRESATQGLSFVNVPIGFRSRNLVKTQSNLIVKECLIEHLPANYCNDEKSKFGKTKIQDTLFKHKVNYEKI
jgi:hypothetical protein